MKMLYCKSCGDIRKLHFDHTECNCKKSWGQYRPEGSYIHNDEQYRILATYGGEAIIFGIDNNTFKWAMIHKYPSFIGWVYHPVGLIETEDVLYEEVYYEQPSSYWENKYAQEKTETESMVKPSKE